MKPIFVFSNAAVAGPSRAAARRRLAPVLVILLASIFLPGQATEVDAGSLPDRKFSPIGQRGCLFSNELELAAAADKFGRAPTNYFRDGRTLTQFGNRIAIGLAESTHWSSLRSSTIDAIIDLRAIVVEAIDRPLPTANWAEDGYWRYYADCDRWQVVFSDRVGSVPNDGALRRAIEFCRQRASEIQFTLVESLPTGRLHSAGPVEIDDSRHSAARPTPELPVFQYLRNVRKIISLRQPRPTAFDMLLDRVMTSIQQNSVEHVSDRGWE